MTSWIQKISADLEHAASFVRQHDNFLVTAHQNADGDAYGAALATARILEALNKRCTIVLPDDPVDRKYEFMPGWDKIIPWSKDLKLKFDAAIAVDVSSRKRIAGPAELFPESETILKIDHHPFEEDFAAVTVESTEASSASILVYYLACHMGLPVDRELALVIYTGIVYDNGNFMNANTGREDFEVAAALIAAGVKPQQVANELHFSNNLPSLQAVGAGLQSMELWLEGQVGWIFLPQEIASAEPRPDTESLANYSVSVQGCQIGVFARQVENNLIKVSLRSRGNADVCQIARFFGGGGHRQAAGCAFEGTVDEFKKQLKPQLSKSLKSAVRH